MNDFQQPECAYPRVVDTSDIHVQNESHVMILPWSLITFLAGVLACLGPASRADTIFVSMIDSTVTYNTAVSDPKAKPFESVPGYVINALAIDAAGNVYAAVGDFQIEKFSPTGKDLGVFAKTGVDGDQALAFDSAGNLYAANDGNDNIEKFTSSGVGSHFATATSNNESLAIDSAGNLYTSLGNNTIEKITPSGVVSVFASGISGLLAFNSAGDLYVADKIHSPTIYEIWPTTVNLGIVATPDLPIFAIAVESAAVPEPSSLVLAGLAAVSISLFACFRHRLRLRAA